MAQCVPVAVFKVSVAYVTTFVIFVPAVLTPTLLIQYQPV